MPITNAAETWTLLHLAALAATIAGAICLYLGMPRQLWLARPWPASSRIGALALLLLGWLSWGMQMKPVTAFFAVLTTTMAALMAVTAIAGLRAARRERRP